MKQKLYSLFVKVQPYIITVTISMIPIIPTIQWRHAEYGYYAVGGEATMPFYAVMLTYIAIKTANKIRGIKKEKNQTDQS